MNLTPPFRLLLILTALLWLVSPAHADDTWKAGSASVVITPEQPMWMAGYGGRDAPAAGKRTDLYAKALALEDAEGNRGVILTMDLVGIGRDFALTLTQELKEKHGLDRSRIALSTSHTHSGPVVGKNLGPLHYWSVEPEQQKRIDAYVVTLREKLVALAGEALGRLTPSRLQHGSGKCTFAVNRRENKPYTEVPANREKGLLKGPVDHDVPVLSVRDSEGNLTAILFGYACHATVLQASEWNGDYPGYAQAELEERYPGAVALFWAGCGGDQNPLPRSEVPLAEQYGAELALRVSDIIKAPMEELKPGLSTSFREIALPLQKVPTAKELATTAKSTNRFEVARSKYLQRKLKDQGAIHDTYPFPIGVWNLGGTVDFVFLGGEVVIDYALRLKQERKGTHTWVAAYSNDVMAYIPSLRVLKEGGYEGGGSNVYYGLPSLWAESVEEVIIKGAAETK
ncbi:MAG: neutral/alkaline non-lysosomal ceramidase N-terminal domain-containing protein [Verrucomicrobiales bacterium]|nr:neutral/alkaline non-lysosomal ceramidase N-terminal domain-containing protein [Verrucomicrobiales bacterium]